MQRPAEARRAFREVAGVEAAKLPERCPGQQDVGCDLAVFSQLVF